MADAKRSVLLAMSGMGGREVAARASVKLWLRHTDPLRPGQLTVIDASSEHDGWRSEFQKLGVDLESVQLTSQQQVARRPDLLSSSTVFLPVLHTLTTTQDTAAWRAFAPALRAAAAVAAYCNYGAFHRSLSVIELVVPFGDCLLLHPKWGTEG